MSLRNSWQPESIPKTRKYRPKMAFFGFFVTLSLLNLMSACGMAQMGEKSHSREQLSAQQTPQTEPLADQKNRPRARRRLQQNQQPESLNEQNNPDSDMLSGKIIYQGQMRTYHLYLPKNSNGSSSIPLVLAFHGGSGSGEKFSKNTNMNALAAQQGFAVVYPDAIDNHWNDGRGTVNTQVDDVGFVKALIERLIKTKNIDKSRIYAAGLSNGGLFTQRLACEMSDQIAAFASVSASLPASLKSNCNPRNPVSMLMINSPDDKFVPWDGGEIRGRHRGEVISVPETIAWWTQQSGSSPTPIANSLPVRNYSDTTRVREARYSGGRGGSEVILYTVNGGGHAWPDTSERHQNNSRFGKRSQQIDANEVIWKFFQRHSLS